MLRRGDATLHQDRCRRCRGVGCSPSACPSRPGSTPTTWPWSSAPARATSQRSTSSAPTTKNQLHAVQQTTTTPDFRSVAIFRATRNGVRPISVANNGAPAIAFGGPRSSCAHPGAHSARHQDSRNDLTPYRMAWHFVSVGAHAPHSDQTLGPTPTRGRRTPLGAYPPRFPVLLQ